MIKLMKFEILPKNRNLSIIKISIIFRSLNFRLEINYTYRLIYRLIFKLKLYITYSKILKFVNIEFLTLFSL